MWQKGKFWLLALLILVVLEAALVFYRVFVLEAYTITAQVDCDPLTESCFVYECEEGDVECEGSVYYKYAEVPASKTSCNTEDPRCLYNLTCKEEEGCVSTYCDPETVSEDEMCAEEVPEEVDTEPETDE